MHCVTVIPAWSNNVPKSFVWSQEFFFSGFKGHDKYSVGLRPGDCGGESMVVSTLRSSVVRADLCGDILIRKVPRLYSAFPDMNIPSSVSLCLWYSAISFSLCLRMHSLQLLPHNCNLTHLFSRHPLWNAGIYQPTPSILRSRTDMLLVLWDHSSTAFFLFLQILHLRWNLSINKPWCIDFLTVWSLLMGLEIHVP